MHSPSPSSPESPNLHFKLIGPIKLAYANLLPLTLCSIIRQSQTSIKQINTILGNDRGKNGHNVPTHTCLYALYTFCALPATVIFIGVSIILQFIDYCPSSRSHLAHSQINLCLATNAAKWQMLLPSSVAKIASSEQTLWRH